MPPSRNVVPHRRHLVGSGWSATTPVDRDKHFRVIGVRILDEDGERSEIVELEALLSGRRVAVRREDLADGSRWRSGWR